MTREEAIDTLKAVKVSLKIYPKRKKQKESVTALSEALDMAIEALTEQVTSKLKNPCDSLLTEDSEDSKEQKSKLDLISRADLKDKWCDYLERAVGNFPITPADITAIIDEAPSVSAESYKDGYDDGI